MMTPPETSPPAEPPGDVPELSVIIVVGEYRDRSARALASVLGQEGIGRMEVLLFDCGPDAAAPLERSDDAGVKYFRVGPSGIFAEVRTEGVQMARAPVVSFLEEHCQAQPGWARALTEAHRGPWTAVGCRFVNGNPGVGWSGPIYRLTYGCHLPPHTPGEVTWIAGHNSSYKREALLAFGERLPLLLTADCVLHEQIRAEGGRLHLASAAVIAHDNENRITQVGHEFFWWNWCFGHIRARERGWGVGRRLLQVALMPLQPWVRLARTIRWSAAAGPRRLRTCLAESWIMLLLHFCAAAGQAMGFLFPMGYAVRTFSHLELNGPRMRSEDLPA